MFNKQKSGNWFGRKHFDKFNLGWNYIFWWWKRKNSAVIFNVSGGQINIAKENAKIDVIMNNIESAKDQKGKRMGFCMIRIYNKSVVNEQKAGCIEKCTGFLVFMLAFL